MSDIPTEPFESEERSRLAGKVVWKMLRKQIIGGHKVSLDTLKNWFPTDQQGDVEAVVEEMLRRPSCPVEGYGGSHRANVRLRDYEEGKEFAEERGYDTEWI